MEIREATHNDVPGILRIRRIVSENALNFELTEAMLHKAISRHCKAFILVDNDEIVAFSMADKAGQAIWGLFVWEPYQGKGYGKLLLSVAVDWLFKQRYGFFRRKIKKIRLTTEPGAPAEGFYQHLGWQKQPELLDGQVVYTLMRQEQQE